MIDEVRENRRSGPGERKNGNRVVACEVKSDRDVQPPMGRVHLVDFKVPGDVPLYKDTYTSFQSGNSLCALRTAQGVDVAQCIGYITGVADMLSGQHTNRICVPSDAVASQVVDVAKKYLMFLPQCCCWRSGTPLAGGSVVAIVSCNFAPLLPVMSS